MAPGGCFLFTHLSGTVMLAAEGGQGAGGFQEVTQVQQLKSRAPPSGEGGGPPSSLCTQHGRERESQGDPGRSPRLELDLGTDILLLCLCGDVSRA